MRLFIVLMSTLLIWSTAMAQDNAETAAFGNFVLAHFADDAQISAKWSNNQSDTLLLFPDVAKQEEYIEIYLGSAVAEIERGHITTREALELYILTAIERFTSSNDLVQPQKLRVLVRNFHYLGEDIVANVFESQKMADFPDGSSNTIAYEHIAGELVLVIAAEDLGGWMYGTADSIHSANMEYEDAKLLALENTLSLIKGVQVNGGENTIGTVMVLDHADEEVLSILTLSKLLDTEFWNMLEAKLGYSIAVTVPDRYTILFAPADNVNAINLLKKQSNEWTADADHIQSVAPILWTGEGWTELSN